jgi:hypothetical protein
MKCTQCGFTNHPDAHFYNQCGQSLHGGQPQLPPLKNIEAHIELGKTVLLRHLAHHSATASFPDGVVYLSARCQPVEDLLPSLFDAFYESYSPRSGVGPYGTAPFKPTDAQLRHALQSTRAFIILDDVELARNVLLDPPAPPQEPPQAPATPRPGISPLAVGSVALTLVALLALRGWGMGKLVKAAGDELAAEFHRRFNDGR